MNAPATSSPAAPEIRARVVLSSPPATSAADARGPLSARAIFAVALAWTVAILSATSYVETWQRRNPSPVLSGTVVVRHP